MTHVVFLNGPPRCGKDTAGRIIADAVAGARVVKFAHALKVATHALFAGLQGRQVSSDKYGYWTSPSGDGAAMEKLHNDAYYEDCKGEPSVEFFGLSPRAAYIAVSEVLCKPLFGKQFFGQVLANEIARHPAVPLWAITDSGFVDEALPIIAAVGRENCTLVNIQREGCTFAGDSRGYIDLDVIAKLGLRNDTSLEQFAYLIRTAVLGKF
jgi:hypothetical protein